MAETTYVAPRPPLPARAARETLIELKGAGVYRDGRWLVRNVDLGIQRGEIVTLIGPNGAGKSTAAKMALRILKPDEGGVSHAPGLRIGYVPQKINIDRTLPLSVERLLTLTGPLSRGNRSRARSGGDSPSGESRDRPSFRRRVPARADGARPARRPDIMVLTSRCRASIFPAKPPFTN